MKKTMKNIKTVASNKKRRKIRRKQHCKENR